MEIIYKDKNIEKVCTDLKIAKKQYPAKIAIKLLKAITFIKCADSVKSIIEMRPYRFHSLKGNRANQYAIDIGSKVDGYRLILSFKDSYEDVFKQCVEIREIIILEMGNHYE